MVFPSCPPPVHPVPTVPADILMAHCAPGYSAVGSGAQYFSPAQGHLLTCPSPAPYFFLLYLNTPTCYVSHREQNKAKIKSLTLSFYTMSPYSFCSISQLLVT